MGGNEIVELQKHEMQKWIFFIQMQKVNKQSYNTSLSYELGIKGMKKKRDCGKSHSEKVPIFAPFPAT